MSDARLRALERRWRETRAPADGGVYLAELERTGIPFIDAVSSTRGEAPKLMKMFPGTTPTYEAARDADITHYMLEAEETMQPGDLITYPVPLLLTAYRTLGRDHHACRVEEEYEALGDQRYNRGAMETLQETLRPRAHREDYDEIRRHVRENRPEQAFELVRTGNFDQQQSALGIIESELSKTYGVSDTGEIIVRRGWQDHRPGASLIWVDDLLQDGRIDDALAVCRLPRGKHDYVGYRVSRHLIQQGNIPRALNAIAPREDGAAPLGFLPCAVYCMIATTLNGKCFDE